MNMKIDIHLHLSPEPLPEGGPMTVSTPEEMIPHMKELGIKKGVLMSSGEGDNPAASFGSNEDCLAIVKKYLDVFSWMCNLDPKDQDTIYERLKTYKDQGAVGIGEFMVNQRIDSPFIQEVFRCAEELDMPVLFHMSPEVGYQYGIVDDPGLPLLEESLKKYPKLKFIGHSQPFWHEITKDPGKTKEERMEWGKGKVTPGGRTPYLFEHYPNLYGDLSANSAGCAIMRDEEFGLEFLKKYKTRLMFATDMVNKDMVFPLGGWLDEKYAKGALDKETYENICYRNTGEILGIRLSQEE